MEGPSHAHHSESAHFLLSLRSVAQHIQQEINSLICYFLFATLLPPSYETYFRRPILALSFFRGTFAIAMVAERRQLQITVDEYCDHKSQSDTKSPCKPIVQVQGQAHALAEAARQWRGEEESLTDEDSFNHVWQLPGVASISCLEDSAWLEPEADEQISRNIGWFGLKKSSESGSISGGLVRQQSVEIPPSKALHSVKHVRVRSWGGFHTTGSQKASVDRKGSEKGGLHALSEVSPIDSEIPSTPPGMMSPTTPSHFSKLLAADKVASSAWKDEDLDSHTQAGCWQPRALHLKGLLDIDFKRGYSKKSKKDSWVVVTINVEPPDAATPRRKKKCHASSPAAKTLSPSQTSSHEVNRKCTRADCRDRSAHGVLSLMEKDCNAAMGKNGLKKLWLIIKPRAGPLHALRSRIPASI